MKRQKQSFKIVKQAAVLVLAALSLAPASGQALTLPGSARLMAEVTGSDDRLALASGSWTESGVPKISAEGRASHRAWRIDDASLSTAALTGLLSGQLVDDGYNVLFECADRDCGGFDFRFELDVIPEPDMHVDLGDFRYVLVSRQGQINPEYAALIVSRSKTGAFVQLTEISSGSGAKAVTASVAGAVTLSAVTSAPTPSNVMAAPLGDITTTLEREGRVALDDLVFASGKSDLGLGQFPSLERLAAYLALNPDKRITLVGHTDATGPLATNVALSRKRAESVAERLIKDLGVRADQVTADGVGFLSPRASNLTEEGRRENRRVEAMLASTR